MRILIWTALIAVMGLLVVPNALSQNSQLGPRVPQFSIQREVRLTGEIREIKNYCCPITGTVGTHLEL
jgi:hypothetical protein